MKMFKDTKAVSPVIGIMLMLVVTVILAAAVSSTSTGLMKSSDPAPMAVFDVKVAKDLSGSGPAQYMTIKLVTGDAIHTKDLKVVTTNPNAAGVQIREKLPGDWRAYAKSFTYEGTVYSYEGNVPYWNNMGKGGFGGINGTNNEDVNFGNYILKPGVSMTAQDYSPNQNLASWNGEDYDLGTGDTISQMQDMFADWDSVSKGDFVNVKIIHMPSNKVIFASNVEVI